MTEHEPWPVEVVPCFRCARLLSSGPEERLWHWDNFNVSWKWALWATGSASLSLVRCLPCMNLENQVISFTPSRPPTAEFLAHRRGQRGETAHVGGQREGRRGEDLFYGKEGLRWKGNQGKGKGKGKGKGEGKGKGSDKGKEGRDARSLETVEEEEEEEGAGPAAGTGGGSSSSDRPPASAGPPPPSLFQ